MSSIKRTALASAVSLSLLSSISIAATPNAMIRSADREAAIIRKMVNVENKSLHCKAATLRIASAAKRQGGKIKGAELRSAIMDATSIAVKKYDLENRCITPVYISDAASKLTGLYSSKGATLGLSKLGAAAGAGGAAAGLLGAGSLSAAGLSLPLLGAGLLAAGTLVAVADDNDDTPTPTPCYSGSTAPGC